MKVSEAVPNAPTRLLKPLLLILPHFSILPKSVAAGGQCENAFIEPPAWYRDKVAYVAYKDRQTERHPDGWTRYEVPSTRPIGKRRISAIEFNADLSLVAIGDEFGSIRVVSTQNGDVIANLNGHIHRISSMWFDARSERLLSVSDDAATRVWDLRKGRQLDDKTAQAFWDSETGDQLARVFDPNGEIDKVAVSKSGNRILIASLRSGVVEWSRNGGID